MSVVQGLRKTCMYCGDGINDLIALGAADVGMTVGSSEASAAATISNRNFSIAGDHYTNDGNNKIWTQYDMDSGTGTGGVKEVTVVVMLVMRKQTRK